MDTPRLYDDLARLWPLLSPPGDYTAEARTVARIIQHHVTHERPSVLELGAGGGHTIFHLRDDFDCTAVDISDEMLAHCRALNPGVETAVGDMRTLRLGRLFDAVLIHDAVDYMTTLDDVRAALRTAAAHLRPGGVAIVAPTYTSETFEDHSYAGDEREQDGVALRYVSYVRALPGEAHKIESPLLIAVVEGGRLRIESDRHTCGLFSESQWIGAMEGAGFVMSETDFDDDADGPFRAFVGVRL
ncbi:MAG: methyltransferase domain-containing protein [Phycisphaera sp.]|nr:methyltransferase domain-containing protein [Phycisphaera sp.]